MKASLPVLNPLLHQPSRTQVVAFLNGRGEATFSELKHALGVTDGNLGTHLAKLVEAGLVMARETASDSGRAQSVYRLTAKGRRALAEYVAHLTDLLALDADLPERMASGVPHTGR
ncbi:MAG: transcriptional regulator [Chromatiales bacterium]|jgi:predicted ArsR family transcriptional regulator|nr:transcriptional regulator [Chromatiales bacterium]MDX9766964.1 transcriptional regulator [Ectothiorhodospiraceae bacterium]